MCHLRADVKRATVQSFWFLKAHKRPSQGVLTSEVTELPGVGLDFVAIDVALVCNWINITLISFHMQRNEIYVLISELQFSRTTYR